MAMPSATCGAIVADTLLEMVHTRGPSPENGIADRRIFLNPPMKIAPSGNRAGTGSFGRYDLKGTTGLYKR